MCAILPGFICYSSMGISSSVPGREERVGDGRGGEYPPFYSSLAMAFKLKERFGKPNCSCNPHCITVQLLTKLTGSSTSPVLFF